MAEQSNIQSAASKSIRPFRSSEEYLYAMKEDLAEWLNALYDLDVQVDNFMDVLETGFDLCQHANNVNRIAQEFLESRPDLAASSSSSSSLRIPRKEVVFQSKNVAPGSFVARDNVSNFIQWCRQELGIQDVLMFETNDLVLRKNEKNFVLCLLEVARKGSKFGMLAPMLIQMEEEIEEEMMRHQGASYGGGFEASAAEKGSRGLGPESPLCPKRTQRMTLCDLKNLDELVREILGHCTCPSQFPMVKVSEGKYKVGDSNALIFVRVLRSHVMVRVGGGWDTLEHYLDKHDPCRCTSFSHRLTQSRGLAFSPQKMAAPGSQPSSPSAQRRSEASGHSGGHSKGLRPGCPVKGPGDSTPPRHASGATPIAAHDGVGARSGPAGHGSAAQTPIGLSALRPRRLSGDSDSSASSVQSGTLGRRRNEDAILAPRKDPGRRVSEGAVLQSRPKKPPDERSQSRDRAAPPRPSPGTRRRGLDERGRVRTAAAQSPHTRARSQGEPVLVISRGKDGAHSWARAEAPKEAASASGRSTPKGHSRSPSLTKRRGSLPAAKAAERVRRPSADAFAQELEQLARHFRTPLRLDPNQEQQLFRRLEEEFLANSRTMMMGLEEEEEGPAAETLGRQNAPDAAAAPDSAYCSSSSSSSSLNFFTKYGLQNDAKEENKRNGAAAAAQKTCRPETALAEFPNGSDAWERTARPSSGSSDESNEVQVASALDGVGERHENPKLRPRIKPRTDSQPDKTPSKIPTPVGYKAAASGRPATGGSSPNPPRRRRPFQNAFSAFAEPSRGPTDAGVADGSDR